MMQHQLIYTLSHFSSDVLTGDIWDTLNSIESPELRQLVDGLRTTLFQSRANSTVTKYLGAFQRWRKWIESHGVSCFPVSEAHFVLYLQHLGESSESKSAVEEAMNAVSWVQQLAGHQPVSAGSIARMTLAGLQRKLAKPKSRKEPITTEMLAKLVEDLGTAPSLADIRLAASSLLAFAAFLRYDDIARLRCCDVQFEDTSMTVRITSSKTDQYRQGDMVVIARTGTATCPVAMLERYMVAAGISPSSKLKLFRGIVNSTKNGERLRQSGSLSYTRMREILLKKLDELGYDKSQFSLHSLRAGGATAAANAGVPDRLFKRHGRWKSELAKDGYIKDSPAALLSVSESLNL